MPAPLPARLAGLAALASLALAGTAAAATTTAPRAALLAGSGDAPALALFTRSGANLGGLSPLGASAAQGVDVASAELDGDHVGDVVAGSGAGVRPRVVVIDGVAHATVVTLKP